MNVFFSTSQDPAAVDQYKKHSRVIIAELEKIQSDLEKSQTEFEIVRSIDQFADAQFRASDFGTEWSQFLQGMLTDPAKAAAINQQLLSIAADQEFAELKNRVHSLGQDIWATMETRRENYPDSEDIENSVARLIEAYENHQAKKRENIEKLSGE